MSDGIVFDNFIITDDKSVADSWAERTFTPKQKQQNLQAKAKSSVSALIINQLS